MSDPQPAALLTHLLSQIRQNVDFLVAQKYMSPADASAVMAKLPSDTAVAHPARRNIPKPAPRIVQARALWAYNANGEEPDDLSFAVGDIIEIVAETNEDWWMGNVNGRQALFPSNYVQKLDHNPSPPLYNDLPAQAVNEKPLYRPFMAAHHGADTPPQPGAVNSLGLQEAPGQEQKKNKFGKYGNTMAHSAAGGVGFGAGAAIGGGLVRAIF
jgi:hypothetical protein